MNEKGRNERLEALKRGDKSAANEIISEYFDRVLVAARKRLQIRNAKGSEPEDIAVSVFESLWRKANEKSFSEDDLATPEELWRLLARMIQFKTDSHARKQMAQKRGAGAVRGESIFAKADGGELPGLESQKSPGFTPQEIMELDEGFSELMAQLEDDTLQKIAVRRMEGYKIAEIANEFDKSERWVKRKLELIRERWAENAGA